MTRLARLLFRFSAGCLLAFLTVVSVATIVRIPWTLDDNSVVVPLAGGFAAGMIFFIFVSRLRILYVCGHELTHWLAAKLFLRETGRLEVKGTGGHVAVDRPNIWIVLAPYFVPVYAVAWTGVYGLVLMFWSNSPAWVTVVFNAGLGIAYAFHVRMTAYALGKSQNDLVMHGHFLSLNVIVFCNVYLVLLSLVIATGEWRRGTGLWWDHFTGYGLLLLRGAWAAARFLTSFVAGI